MGIGILLPHIVKTVDYYLSFLDNDLIDGPLWARVGPEGAEGPEGHPAHPFLPFIGAGLIRKLFRAPFKWRGMESAHPRPAWAGLGRPSYRPLARSASLRPPALPSPSRAAVRDPLQSHYAHRHRYGNPAGMRE